jgi:cyclic lactone autoinducer peptide
MKKLNSVISKMVKSTAEKALERDANVTTCAAVYQPKAPASLEKFKKHID